MPREGASIAEQRRAEQREHARQYWKPSPEIPNTINRSSILGICSLISEGLSEEQAGAIIGVDTVELARRTDKPTTDVDRWLMRQIAKAKAECAQGLINKLLGQTAAGAKSVAKLDPATVRACLSVLRAIDPRFREDKTGMVAGVVINMGDLPRPTTLVLPAAREAGANATDDQHQRLLPAEPSAEEGP